MFWMCHFVKVVLIHIGVTSVIAHIKVGQMHAALESKVLVISAQGQHLYAKNASLCDIY